MKAFILFISFFYSQAFAQQHAPDPLRDKAFTLKRFLDQHHYKPLQWNDSASMLLYDRWINALDDDKMIFTRQDINKLQSYRTALDDELNGKSWQFYKASTNIYKGRIHFADSVIKLILAKPLDFSKPDNVERPFKNYAENEAELANRYRDYFKYEILDNIYDKLSGDSNKAVSANIPADFSKQENALRARLLKRHANDMQVLQTQKLDDELADQYLDAIAWCYDPHTNYMNLKAKDAFEAEVSAMKYSAGFSFEDNDKEEKVVGYLQPGGSAWRSGQLHKGDVLLKIKASGTETDVADLSAEELNRSLSTEGPGEIYVTVRTSAGETKNIKLVTEEAVDEESVVKSYLLKGNKNIGYINLPGFYSREEEGEKEMKYNGCANDVSKEMIKLKKDNIAGLILDLRDNGGGSMWEAMQLAGIFIDAGPVASIKSKDGKIEFLKDPNRGTIYDGPMIILINGQSASASEFFTATLQDYNRALIVGGTTYGKGTAQTVEPLDTGGSYGSRSGTDFVKVTGKKFYRVNGSTVQWKGVVPDIALPDLYSDVSLKEKGEASALQPDMSRAGYFQPLPALPVSMLKAKSEARVKDDPYFRTILQFTEKLQTLKDGTVIPLQWAGFVQSNKAVTESIYAYKEEKKEKPGMLTEANNSYDDAQLRAGGVREKEINTAYLKNIDADNEITEACKILGDWIAN